MANDDLLFKAGMDSGDFARGIGGIIKNVEGMALSLLGLGSASLTLKYMADEALKDEKATMALASAVKGLKTGTEEGFLALKKYAEQMSEATGIADEELSGALKTLVFATGDTTAAQKSLGAVIDLSRAKEISLEAAAKIVGKAYDGNTQMLKRYGIELDKHASGMTVINELTKKFGGAEDSYLASTQGKLDKAKNSFNLLANEIGSTFLPSMGDAANAVTKFLRSFTQEGKIGEQKEKISELTDELKTATYASKNFDEQQLKMAGYSKDTLPGLIAKLTEDLEKEKKKLTELGGAWEETAKKQYKAAVGAGENEKKILKMTEAEERAAKIASSQWDIATAGIGAAFNKLGATMAKGDWATGGKEMLQSMAVAAIDVFETVVKAKLAADIANSINPLLPLAAAGSAAGIPIDFAQIAGLEGLKGIAMNVGGAANGLYADESMYSTFSPREIVVPQRFSDLIASGKMSLHGGNTSTSNTSHGPVSIIVNGADKSPRQIALEIAHYFKSDRGGRLVRADGSMNM
jgi:hypothetical protein